MNFQLTIVKVGGKIIEEPDSLNALLKDFSRIAGYKMLIHGGGRLATELAEKLGIESKMADGRRITDEETLKIVTMVYAGWVNKNIVVRLQASGVDAVGLTGADMNLIVALKRPVKDIDYGFVGDIKSVNSKVLSNFLSQGFVPVLTPLTHDGDGNLLNTNADSIAAETAAALAYDFNVRLIYCFEKNGVLRNKNDEKSVISTLDKELYQQYKNEGIIKDGMIPKLDSAFRARAAGVPEIVITSAAGLNAGGGTYIQ
ncbi:MAG: acetylglutamate kinase [Dysgonamonadaceae bacterium]|jgi:acetylglutamate kinase|nr:acetylglutamate kinase [Dysgonamonadaceae bacterium]